MYFDLQGMLEPRELARGWLREHTRRRAAGLPAARVDARGMRRSTATASPAAARRCRQRAPAWWGKPRNGGPARLAAVDFADSVGSNNWAVAGSRSKDGAAIVSDDMHLGIQLPNTWYRLALRFPDADGSMRRVVGVTLPGAPPVIVVGSNGKVAWGFTNSYGDYLDLVEVNTDPAQPGEVRTPAGWETPARHDETILVKGAPAEKFVVRTTSFGPVREAGGRSYAIHWIAHMPRRAINLNPMQARNRRHARRGAVASRPRSASRRRTSWPATTRATSAGPSSARWRAARSLASGRLSRSPPATLALDGRRRWRRQHIRCCAIRPAASCRRPTAAS